MLYYRHNVANVYLIITCFMSFGELRIYGKALQLTCLLISTFTFIRTIHIVYNNLKTLPQTQTQ